MKRMSHIVFLVISLILVAQSDLPAEPKEPKLIKELKFPNKVQKLVNGVVVTEREIAFLDLAGNIKSKKTFPSNSQIEISKDGKRIGQLTYSDITEKGAQKKKFKMLDDHGEVIWETDKLVSPIFSVSQANGGTVFEPDCYMGGCGKNIKIINKQNPNGKVVVPQVVENATITGSSVSDDGNYFLVILRTFAQNYKGPSDIVVYDASGNQTWSKHFEDERVQRAAVSGKGTYIVANVRPATRRETYIYVFGGQGTVLLRQQVEFGDYDFRFDESESKVVAYSDNGSLYLIDPQSPSVAWQYVAKEKNAGFISAAISSGFIAATSAEVTSTDENATRNLYVLDGAGTLLLKKKISAPGFSSWRQGARVEFKNKARSIVVTLFDAVLEYQNEFAY